MNAVLLELPEHFQLDAVTTAEGQVCCRLSLTNHESPCPCCGSPSHRVHSTYWRHLTDLLLGANTLLLNLCLRKYFCDSPGCSRQIFAERIPEVARPYARRTERLTRVIADIGCECGGEAGSFLAAQGRLGDWVPNTILNVVRGIVPRADYTPRILGVDDWAMRKGVRYGTLLCDLELGAIIDLLPDRDSQTLQTWLTAHPGIEIVSRDRASAYSEAVSKAAPTAIQVANRFHLLVNVGDALERVVVRHARELRIPDQEQALPALTFSQPQLPEQPTLAEQKTDLPGRRVRQATATGTRQKDAEDRRALRLAKYERVRELKRQGYSMRQIERIIPASQDLIRHALQTVGLPVNGNYRRLLEPFVTYLTSQCEAGNLNASALCRQIKTQGYTGHYFAVVAFVAQYRVLADAPIATTSQLVDFAPEAPSPAVKTAPKTIKLTPREVTRLLRTEPDELADANRRKAVSISATVQELDAAGRLSRTFKHVLMNKQPERLDDWLKEAAASAIPELCRFANGIIRDKDAVLAAIRLHWSNGPTEGHVNRLKTVKRQMYGRGRLDLLRGRLLHQRAP